VWAGTLSGGVSRIQNGRITTFTPADGLSGDPITTFLDAADGTVWVGTTSGLQAFRDSSWKRYSGSDGLPPGRVNSLAFDRSGVLWIGTTAGLFRSSSGTTTFVRYAPELLQTEVLGVAADQEGHLWIATNQRVMQLLRSSPGLPAVREFTTLDGLPSTQLIQRDHALSRDPAGRIWLGLRGGLCVVDPARAVRLPAVPVSVQSVEVDGVPLHQLPAAQYPADRRRIAFKFIGVSLSVPGRVRYRYRLDNYDADWSSPIEAREADYTNLPPGQYTFRLMATNGEGLWNGGEATVAFTVVPLFWQTLWFRLAAAGVGVTILFAAYRYRLDRIRDEMNMRFEERLAERTRIAQELHDTLLQGFLSASMQLQVAADLVPEDSKSRPLITRALQLMRQVIEEGRVAVKGLRSGTTSSVPLEAAFSAIADEVGDGTAVNFRVIVEGARRELHPLLHDEVYRITREAILNAFRHAHAKHIDVELNYAPDCFRVFVRDDGLGMDPSVLKTGRDGHWGLVGMRERAERISAQLHVYSRLSAGTEIELAVPAKVAFRTAGKKQAVGS
jgi:signal transduction histidine kinase/sugar lactone lactonase YvrE